jgi:hypothetical protein
MMNKLATIFAVAVSLGLALSQPASAQLDYGRTAFGVYEDGMLVGEILRVESNPSHYVEHWVLYPNYVYPSAKNNVALEIRPGLVEYRDTADFFARVPWSAGSRYVKSDCLDGTELPSR